MTLLGAVSCDVCDLPLVCQIFSCAVSFRWAELRWCARSRTVRRSMIGVVRSVVWCSSSARWGWGGGAEYAQDEGGGVVGCGGGEGLELVPQRHEFVDAVGGEVSELVFGGGVERKGGHRVHGVSQRLCVYPEFFCQCTAADVIACRGAGLGDDGDGVARGQTRGGL